VFAQRNAIEIASGATYNLNMCRFSAVRGTAVGSAAGQDESLFALPAPADAIRFHVGSRGGTSRQGLFRQGLSHQGLSHQGLQ
jgi:hypothetical protein